MQANRGFSVYILHAWNPKLRITYIVASWRLWKSNVLCHKYSIGDTRYYSQRREIIFRLKAFQDLNYEREIKKKKQLHSHIQKQSEIVFCGWRIPSSKTKRSKKSRGGNAWDRISGAHRNRFHTPTYDSLQILEHFWSRGEAKKETY